MADRDREDSTLAATRKTITSDDVRRLVDHRAMPQFQGADGQLRPAYEALRPEWRAVYDRLRSDPDGKVSAALNKLRKHDPALVLAELMLALQTAARLPLLKRARDQAAKHRERARRLHEIAADIEGESPPGAIDLRARGLRAIADQFALDADTTEESLMNGPWSRKNDDDARAFAGAAARDLARRLFGETHADHAAISMLLSAAIGADIPLAAVANALRSTVRTTTRSKAKTPRERVFSKIR